MKNPLPPDRWRCSSLHAMMAGLFASTLSLPAGAQDGTPPRIQFAQGVPQLAFAADRIAAALGDSTVSITLEVREDPTKPESFSIQRPADGGIVITGTDAAGAMYGGLEVAELLAIGGAERVREDRQSPALGMRGIKFNIPLDVRTPSYTDMGDAGQENIRNVWDFGFWKEFIDEAARHRYNYISLWNLHPFPSLVKVPEYPDVALDDVLRAVNLERKYYSGRGENFDDKDILDETETVLKISIGEKIDFWRRVMRYGRERNVDFYFITWNIHNYGTQGKYGIKDTISDKTTIDYFRKSVKQLFLTYPDLKGIGVTAGEHMHDSSARQKEDWLWETYGEGVLDALAEQPEREITFLHRQHEASAGEIADRFRKLVDHPRVDFIFSYKYAKAHAYSAVEQPFYRDFEKEIAGRDDGLKTIWTMRNDSTYFFRWAAPRFMREFVRGIPRNITRGYYLGSDGWIWGRDFVSKDEASRGRLELKNHWFQWMLWGRLAYDPGLPEERFTEILQAHFPGADAANLMDAWQRASMVFPIVTGFHWGVLDYRWFPEACIGVPSAAKRSSGFHDLNSFISLGSHPGAGYATIPEYVKALKKGDKLREKSPLEVAAELLENSGSALNTISAIKAGDDAELAATLKDIEAMAHLSRYYGHKINAATHLHRFREMADPSAQQAAVAEAKQAAEAWRAYVGGILDRFINPIWYGRIRTGPIDYAKIIEWGDVDVEIAAKNLLSDKKSSRKR